MVNITKLLKYQSQSNDQNYFKETFLINCLFIAVCSFSIYSIVNYFLSQKIGASVMAFGALFEVIILIFFVKKIIPFVTTVNTALFIGGVCLSIDIYTSGLIFSSGLPWMIVFPLISFYLLEHSISTRFWVITSILIIMFFGCLSVCTNISAENTTSSQLDHTFSYVGLVIIFSLLAYIFDKQKQDKLQEGEKQFRTMFDQAPLGITIFNSNTGGIDDLNPKYAEIVGRTKEEIKKIGWENLTHPDDLQEDLDNMASIKRGDISGFKMSKRYIKPDNSIVWVDMTITAFKTKKKDNYHYLCMIEDITDRKLLEESQKKDTQMLEKKSRILARQNEQLNDFCDIVSHNLRAPLASISMLTDYIDKCKDETERNEMISKINPVVNNLNEIFTELVESLQIEQDIEIQSDNNDLKEVMAKIIKRFEIEINLAEANIIVNIEETPTIFYPHLYLDSIISNLISNSLKYRSSARKLNITISTKKVGDTILFSISDNGLGIDLNRHANSIFKIRKVFHEHPEAKGFGLYITKKQVEVLSGKIWVESTPEKGSAFFVEFKNQKYE